MPIYTKYLIELILLIGLGSLMGCGSKTIEIPVPDTTAKSFEESIEIVGSHFSISKSFVLDDQIWVADQFGLMHHSTNLGTDWQEYSAPLNTALIYMGFANSGKNVILVDKTNHLFNSSDAGETWNKIDLNTLFNEKYTQGYRMESEQFEFTKDLSIGQFVAGCEIFQSQDFGDNWKSVSGNVLGSSDDKCVEKAYMNKAGELEFALVYIDVGYGTNKLFRTADNGKTWESDICPHDLITALDQLDPMCPEEIDAPDAFNTKLRYFEIRNDGELFEKASTSILAQETFVIDSLILRKLNMPAKYFSVVGGRVWFDFGTSLGYTENQGEKWNIVYKNTEDKIENDIEETEDDEIELVIEKLSDDEIYIDKHYVAADKKTIWAISDENELLFTIDLGENWKKHKLIKPEYEHYISVSPSEKNLLIISQAYLTEYTDDKKKSNLQYYVLHDDGEVSHYKFPEPNSYVEEPSEVCWLNDELGIISVYRDDEKSYETNINYATTDGGKTWATTEFQFKSKCRNYGERMLLGNKYVRVKN